MLAALRFLSVAAGRRRAAGASPSTRSGRVRGPLAALLAGILAFGCIEGAKYQGGGDTPDEVDVPDDGVNVPDDGTTHVPDDGGNEADDWTSEADDWTSEADDWTSEADDWTSEADDWDSEADDWDSEADEGGPSVPELDVETEDLSPLDSDGDGDPDVTDCAPHDARNGHGLVEVCDGQDNDCDDVVDPGCAMTLRAGLASGGAAYPLADQSGALRLGRVVVGQTAAGPSLRSGETVRLAPGLTPVLGQPAP